MLSPEQFNCVTDPTVQNLLSHGIDPYFDEQIEPAFRTYAVSLCDSCSGRQECILLGVGQSEGLWGGLPPQPDPLVVAQKARKKAEALAERLLEQSRVLLGLPNVV